VINSEYRKLRGTDQPITSTEQQLNDAWYTLNHEAIDHRRQRAKRFKGKRWRGGDQFQVSPEDCQDCED
jgi:hypothetical protein